MDRREAVASVAVVLVIATACGPSAMQRPETSPAAAVAGAASPTQAPTMQERTTAGRDIYVVDPRSGRVTPLVSASGSQTNAELSPDGRLVVYESHVPGSPSQIWLLEDDGTRRKLTRMKGGAFDPTWSPDGRQIAFAGRRGEGPISDADIFVMNVDGALLRRRAGTAESDGHPSWSPDGSRVVFHSRSGGGSEIPGGAIWVMSVATGTVSRLTGSSTPVAAVDPAWSPDGRWIAYGGFERSTLNGRVYTTWLGVMRPNGTHRRRITRAHAYHLIENPSWSPNGSSIVFEENSPPAVGFRWGFRWDGSYGDIGVVAVRTQRPRWIVTDARSDQPSWSPDGILVSLSPGAVEAMHQATAGTGWDSAWEPSWSGRPDATIVLTGSRCEQVGGARVIDPGVLTIEFVNDSSFEGLFRVSRLAPRERPSQAWEDAPPYLGRRSSTFIVPSTSRSWSSSREITTGRWTVLCWKDVIAASNGFQMMRVDVVGPIAIG